MLKIELVDKGSALRVSLSCGHMMLLTMQISATLASPLWVSNHTSQVKSMSTIAFDGRAAPVVVTGSQFDADQSVSSVDMQSGRIMWSSNTLRQWTYGVAVRPASREAATPAAPSLATFGCQFDAGQAPVAPCELGFWLQARRHI